MAVLINIMYPQTRSAQSNLFMLLGKVWRFNDGWWRALTKKAPINRGFEYCVRRIYSSTISLLGLLTSGSSCLK
jgi:hypothetical protein